MKTLQFKCEMLSDVILNVKTATEGNQSTLDFIPGNCFLGIVANTFQEFTPQVIDLLFSGKVRFGDAHLAGESSNGLYRSLHIPASMMYKKLYDLYEGCYLHHYYQRSKDKKGTNGGPMQLKQCRNGYYIFAGQKAIKVDVQKSFAIKSAYDRESRRSKDEQMYGYESIGKGATFLFEVECDDEKMSSIIENSLIGHQRIGRSRTAEYGLVNIEKTSFNSTTSRPKGISIDGKHYISVYADGRLLFTNKEGLYTFTPEASDFGINGTICWEKSQIRTFQYAPYNYKRRTRDTDRCGIEKGSVFVIETEADAPTSSTYVGQFRNEGFGRIIFNPDFLDEANDATNGECSYKFVKRNGQEKEITPFSAKDTPLLQYLRNKEREDNIQSYIYKTVNDFTDNKAKYFRKEVFASQWGSIRSIAMRCKDYHQLNEELFTKTRIVHHYPTLTDDRDYDKEVSSAYLTHGMASKKWEGDRIKYLKDFIENVVRDGHSFGRDISVEAVINLASEMAKKCRRNGN